MFFQVNDLTVHYEGARALNKVSFSVAEGSIVALLGANGAGKTTLLNTISGLKRLTSGEIWFCERRIDPVPAESILGLGISHCPEGGRLYPEMTVLENLKMGAYLRRDPAAMAQDMETLSRSFPVLGERANQRASTLSGGERQMVAIARSLMSRPKLLLLDEPSLGLSPLLVKEVARIVSEIRQTGVSVLLVEQNSRMALSIADFAYVMELGEVRLAGSPAQVAQDEHVRKAYLGM